MRFSIYPIEGWGWHRGSKRITPPPPFKLEAEGDFRTPLHAFGSFDDADHPLSGMWIHILQRHLDWDGDCNVKAFAERPGDPNKDDAEVSGFAKVVIL